MTLSDNWKFFDMLTCEHPMLADIEWWMTQPRPAWIPDRQKQGRLGEDEL